MSVAMLLGQELLCSLHSPEQGYLVWQKHNYHWDVSSSKSHLHTVSHVTSCYLGKDLFHFRFCYEGKENPSVGLCLNSPSARSGVDSCWQFSIILASLVHHITARIPLYRHGLSEIGELCCIRGASSCRHGFSCSESHGFAGSCLDISLFCCLQKNMGPEGRNTFLRCKSSLFATKFSPTPTQIHSLCRKTQIHANAEPFVTEPNSHSARAGSVMVQSRRC